MPEAGTILITGACGFVGLALVEHLLARDDTVIGWDRMPVPPEALSRFSELPGCFMPIQGDVCDSVALGAVLKAHRPRSMILLAAVTAGAERERTEPEHIFEVNLVAVTKALRLAAEHGVERVLLVSSGSVYGDRPQAAALHEKDTPLRPEGLYGISKQAAEAAALRLAALNGIDLRIGRLGTCFGPWERDTGVRDTPSAPLQALRRLRAGEPVRLPRTLRRDWLYVRDAAAAIAALLDLEQPTQPVYNLAAGFEWSVEEWCAWVAAHPGFEEADWRIAADTREVNINAYAEHDRASMDISALRRDTGFAPRFDMQRAAADFIAWLDLPAHGGLLNA